MFTQSLFPIKGNFLSKAKEDFKVVYVNKETMLSLKTVLILLACCDMVSSKRYCTQDADCDVIGDLTCQKSVCDGWGICGCPRGQASRFVGSSLKFQCVILKKIGESCSTDGTSGVCGPLSSQCIDGKCECTGTSVPIWDGERCSSADKNDDSSNSETCSDSLGTCKFDSSTCTKTGGGWAGTPFDGLPNTCACVVGQHTIIPNDYDKSDFVGRRVPQCVDIVVGDMCLTDDDCKNIRPLDQAKCNSQFKCECGTGSPYNQGRDCGTNLIKRGDTCRRNNAPVNGGICMLNMVCGDVCDVQNYANANNERKCVCAPGFNGANCNAVASGDECRGDAMCKGLGYDALCLDGVCRAGASTAVLSSIILLFAFVIHMCT